MMDKPDTPYYAVIFQATLRADRATATDPASGQDYAAANEEMFALVAEQPGYLGYESYTRTDGVGMTISYWESLDAIAAWRRLADHARAQGNGRRLWYGWYEVETVKVERHHVFGAPSV